jgi:hypothetical protein
MCFSATASFATGAALLPAGVYCMRSAAVRDRDYLALAAVPVVFSVQQACEGLVWVGLARNDPGLARTAALGFLLFALVFWPSWTPFSVRFIEHRRRVRWALGWVAAAALFVSLLVYVPLAARADEWLHPGIRHHSILYEFDALPLFRGVPRAAWQVAYVAVVFTSLIVPGNRKLTIFGILLVASAVLSHLAFWYAFLSVWCAFSAVLSAWLCHLFATLPPPSRAPAGRETPAAS